MGDGIVEKVLGIGGFFWRSHDPKGLGKWYEEHLGIPREAESYDALPWVQDAGTTIFVPFRQDTTYFAVDKQWMINFRVRNLAAMVAQLAAKGVGVEVDPEHYPNGWFATLKDPEGNTIQLWEEEPYTPPSAS